MEELGANDNLSNTQQQLVSSSLNQKGSAPGNAPSLQNLT